MDLHHSCELRPKVPFDTIRGNEDAPSETDAWYISSDEDDFVPPPQLDTVIKTEPGTDRKNIREIMSKATLSNATLEANSKEKERRKRIEEMQKKYSQFEMAEQAGTSGGAECVLEFNISSEEPVVQVHQQLSKRMKPLEVLEVLAGRRECSVVLERIDLQSLASADENRQLDSQQGDDAVEEDFDSKPWSVPRERKL